MPSTLPPAAERFTGFAGVYDRSRPNPPEALGEILPQLAGAAFPSLVVDLGCGTGLSTRFWASRSRQVVGVDPSPDMLARAREENRCPNVGYIFGYGDTTGLAAGHADIVTCSQALHWMEPEPTLAEVHRLLRPGGVFAAYDHVLSPLLLSWEAEQAYQAFLERVEALDESLGVTAEVIHWPKSEHLPRMGASGYFSFTREFFLHHVEMGDASRLVSGALSYGKVQSLLKAGVSEAELGLDALRQQAHHLLGDKLRPWYWSVHVRLGLRA